MNGAKSQFLVPYGKSLGHIVSAQGMATNLDKVAVIINLPIPNTISEVKGFLGHSGYYCRHIFKYATLVLFLSQLLKKSELPLVWIPSYTKAFHTLKQKLISAPVLVPPNWNKDFDVYVDASNVTIGNILSQKDDSQHNHLIYFASRQLNVAKKNYFVVEREALGMIFSVQKFCHYLLGYKFIFYVDHNALKYIINKPQLNGRVARWVLLLQEFNFIIQIRPRKHHANADHLLQILDELGFELIDDEFPDTQLFNVDVTHPEYADRIYYLDKRIFPQGCNDK